MLSTLLLLAVIVLSGIIVRMYQERKWMKQSLHRYESIASREEVERQLDANIYSKGSELNYLVGEQERLENQITSLQQELSKLSEEDYLQSLGFYEPKYDFLKSEYYESRFNQVTAERKNMIKNKTATACYKNWRVGEDEKKGKELIENYLKLIRGTFDTTCEIAISEAKISNVNRLRKKITDTFERLNKWSKVLECEIREEYLNLRLIELDLKYELELKRQEEREKYRLIREQVAKEKKERQEAEKLRKEIEEAEEKERIHQQELDKVRKETELAEGEKRRQLELRLRQLEQQVAQDRSDKEDFILRYRKLKSGFIYVISSIGSFEQSVYRICMTQSNEPDKYIKDMNPVVPFPFYTHFKVFSEDVSDTLKRLHEAFSDRRVNKVNPRRDFFRVSLEEVDRVINKIANDTGVLKSIQRFETIPLENEYLRTRTLERKDNQVLRTKNNYRGDEIA